MAKLTTTDLTSLTNETSAVTQINNNFAAVETAMENTLSRDGTTPNTMSADIDLNSNSLLNVGSFSFSDSNAFVQLSDFSNGVTAYTGSALVGRTLTASGDGISIADGDGVSGNPTITLGNDLAALEGLSGTGVSVRTGADTWTTRTITGTSAEITVTDGDGVSGNPTVSIPTSFDLTSKTTSVATPSSAGHAATKQYVDDAVAGIRNRTTVRAATTANITISTALNNGDTLDGVTLATDDVVLVKDQTAQEENGIYIVGAVPARSTEFDTYDEHPGSTITVQEGSTNADTLWLCQSNEGGTLNTTAIVFAQVFPGTGGTVTSVSSGNGLTGGPITSTGTLSVQATSLKGAAVTASGIEVNPNNATDTAIATGDEILFADASDSNNVKKDTVQGILDLAASSVGANLIINGDMRIAQRGTSFVSPSANTYTLDRWKWRNPAGSGAVTITQDTDTPNNTFRHSIKVDVTTADTSLTTNDFYGLFYRIEGYDAAHLAFGASDAQTVTLSFWVKSTKTGTFSIGFGGINTRSYIAEYSVSASDTWEQKSITLTGDTTGTWNTTNSVGLEINFPLASGPDWQLAAGSWSASTDFASTNQVNAMDNTANNFFLTGVKLEVGSTATDFVPDNYGTALAKCQRYYHQLDSNGTATYFASGMLRTTTDARFIYQYPVPMRAVPTFTAGTASYFRVQHAATTGTSSSVGAAGNGTIYQIMISCTVGATTAGQGALLYFDNAAGTFNLNAEL